MKKAFTLCSCLVLIVMVFSGVAFAGKEEKKEQITIGVSFKSKGPPYWERAEKGIMMAGEDFGIKVTVQSPPTIDAAAQATILDNYITAGSDALVVAANDVTALNPVIDRANERGIPTITFDSDAPDSSRKYFIQAQDFIKFGARLSELLIEEMGEEGKVAIMVGSLSAQNLIEMTKGAQQVLNKYDNIEVVKTVESGDDQQQAFINAENLIKSYPDLTGILGIAAGEPPAAAEAIEQAGKPGKIHIVGSIVPSTVKQYFESGTMKYGVLWDPQELAYIAARVAYMVLNGESPQDGDILYPGGTPIVVEGDIIYTGVTVFTPENINDYDF
jgi:ABC-type sugar transport system substrate-binding protein